MSLQHSSYVFPVWPSTEICKERKVLAILVRKSMDASYAVCTGTELEEETHKGDMAEPKVVKSPPLCVSKERVDKR